MYVCFFESSYGYNPQVRIDRLYIFSSRISVHYLLDINQDLVDKSIWLRFFIHKLKKYLRKLKIARMITPAHIRSVEIGQTNWNTIFQLLDKTI